jgi:hypothetical protein
MEFKLAGYRSGSAWLSGVRCALGQVRVQRLSLSSVFNGQIRRGELS